MLYLCEKEEVGQEIDETISDIHKIVRGELLSIDGDNVCEGYGMFEKVMYFYIFLVYVLLRRFQKIR